MVQPLHLLAGGLLSLGPLFIRAAPAPLLVHPRATTGQPELRLDFPDPAIIQDTDGTWYSFATNSNGKHVQAARAPDPAGPWTWLDVELLPDGGWTTGLNTWAPDIRRVGTGYVMYYSGEVPGAGGRHCIGAATSKTILGPYAPKAEPFACPLDQGGAIDPSGFFDVATRKRYVTYKVDGNNIGHGGDCNNGVEPLVGTPLVLQEVAADGLTPVGAPVTIMDRIAEDGPLVEAPNIARTTDGTYILFFSSHCFTDPNYDVKYATAKSVTGPYTRGGRALLKSGDFGLSGPGGATSVSSGGKIVFHANCEKGRCLYAADYVVRGTDVVIS
jgi:beta-xylosidase